MSRARCTAAAVSMATVIVAGAASADASGARLRLDPPEVSMGMFFNGVRERFEATVPAGQAAAVICTGEEGPLELKRKGKVWGFLWMNVGEVKLTHVPSLYLVRTSRPISELAARGPLEEVRLGYRALGSSIGGDEGGVFPEVVKLKESEGLYSVEEEGLRLESRDNETARFSGSFLLPAHIPPGEYTVRLIGFEGGKARILGERKLRVVREGLARMITSLAQDHGLYYGLFAVIVALGAGILTGFVFGKGAKKAH